MNLAMKKEQENNDTHNIAPLGSDEIKSILRSQSESVYEDKNISNNSNFVKKSLIDIALDFKSNQKSQKEEDAHNKIPENTNSSEVENDPSKDEQNTKELVTDENNESEKNSEDQVESEQSNNQEELNKTNEEKLKKVEEHKQFEKIEQEKILRDIKIDSEENQNDVIREKKGDELVRANNQTQQALDSVRDAVSQSMNENEEVGVKNEEDAAYSIDSVSEKIHRDYDNFKNILSSLSTLGEEAIYEVFQNKILEISYELAGYQIDKMPEKYEKKIKSFLKSINCFDDKITIEVNDKDFKALSKIKNFNENEVKNIFVSNKELSRGDMVLNCDGMRYSEKSNHTMKDSGINL